MLEETVPTAGPRVLIVEDEPRLRQLLLAEIPAMGFAAAAAPTAEEARRMMRSEASEILVLDLMLPLMGGMEFFAEVRQQWPQTQVIILTGFGGLDAARQAIHLDAVDFLTKPCRMQELEQALSRASQRWRAQVMRPKPPRKISAPGATMADHDRKVILEALARNQNNVSQTAKELGISRRKLHYRLAEYKQQGQLEE